MKKLFSLILLLSFSIKAQSQIIFDNVRQSQFIAYEQKLEKDSSIQIVNKSSFNFGQLSKAKVEELGNYLKVLLKYKNSKEGYNLYDYDGNTPVKPKDLIKQLVMMIDVNPKDGLPDSMDIYRPYDSLFIDPLTGKQDPEAINKGYTLGEPYAHRVIGNTDSTWFFRTLSGFRFTEDWIIDTVKFTCDIKSKSFSPLVLIPSKEDLGPCSFYEIKPKPSIEKQTFNFITDFILTDIYIDDEDERNQNERNQNYYNKTNLDTYKTLILINFIIDKAKLGKIACFNPIIPFNSQLTTAELKSLLTEDISFNKADDFQVRNKLCSYSFKMVEKWAFDSKSLAFKKVALGIVLMKIKKKTILYSNSFNYTFCPVFYMPFNKK